MSSTDSLRRWLVDAADQAVRVAADDVVRDGAELFRSALRTAPERPAVSAQPLPVLRNAGAIDDTELGRRFARFAHTLPWSTSPRWNDGGEERALCALGDVFELPGLTAGLLYLDTGGTYPAHSHSPQELYLTIAGKGRWRYGGSERFVRVPPGVTLYNHPDDVHAIEAMNEPLLAMYILWGDGVV